MTGTQPKPTGRAWQVVSVSSFDDIRAAAAFSHRAFILLLVADARGQSDEALRGCGTELLKAGARYVCAWGPDCERVHDAFDQAAVDLGLDREGAVIMTTWHDHESLQETTWSAANAALPDEAYPEADRALVAIAVGSEARARDIQNYLQAGTPMDDEE